MGARGRQTTPSARTTEARRTCVPAGAPAAQVNCLSAPCLGDDANVFVSLKEQLWAEVKGMLRTSACTVPGATEALCPGQERAHVSLVQLLPQNYSPAGWRSMPV